MSENDFECLASTAVNTPGTMFPNSGPSILDFPEADFGTALGLGWLPVCPLLGTNWQHWNHSVGAG
jgi:hypothetical protein